MKRILIPIMVLFAFTSCQKKACYVCKLTSVTEAKPSTVGFPYTTTTDVTKCDLTEKEANEYEQSMVTNSSSTQGNITVTVKNRANCIPQ